MTGADLDVANRIAVVVHPGYPERPEVMAERLRLFPAGCLVAVDPADGTVVGYAVAHPARPGQPPALDSLLDRLDGGETCLHLHDIALLPQARRGGLGARAVRRLVAAAREGGLTQISLVAVGDAAPYWERLGFRDAPTAGDGGALASYGAAARYMTAATEAVAARL